MSIAQDVCVAVMLACSAGIAGVLIDLAVGDIRDARRDRDGQGTRRLVAPSAVLRTTQT